MKLVKNKNIWFWLVMVALLSFFSVYHYMTLFPQEVKKPEEVAVFPQVQQVIKPSTNVYLHEQYDLCQKYNLACINKTKLTGLTRLDLNGFSLKELEEIYPKTAGWDIQWQDKNMVILRHLKPGLCPEHRKRWHLYPDESGERIAVYLGPSAVEIEGGLIQRTYIKIDNLPLKLQEKIINGSMEFIKWEDLIATLDSLDEFKD